MTAPSTVQQRSQRRTFADLPIETSQNSSMADVYSEEELDLYLETIGIPTRFKISQKPAVDVDFLTALHVHQISTFPYENLSLHYSSRGAISLEPHDLYRKLITDRRGRGGYCCELSIFMYHVLRGLGFNVYHTGVRIRPRIDGIPQGSYLGWVHMVNIVAFDDGSRYMVDVGFGGDGATKPLPLIHGQVTWNIGTQELRLVHDTIPDLTTGEKLWIYQYRNGSSLPWNSFYCFTEHEFLFNDLVVMSHFASTRSFQQTVVLAIKFLQRESQVYGKVMLAGNTLKTNTGGKTRIVKICVSEKDRLAILTDYFGITLTEEERHGIRGKVSEILDPSQISAPMG